MTEFKYLIAGVINDLVQNEVAIKGPDRYVMDMMQMQIITIKELSELLKVKPKTLYQWAESKQIPCLKINGALRFDLEDILQWIASCKNTPSGGYNPIAQTAGVRSPKKGVSN